MGRDRSGWLAIAACGLLCWPAVGAGEPQDSPERGKALYQLYCSGCHGKKARGDGPVASELRTAPPDLTRIARRNGGSFPAPRVYDKILGINELPGHGPREMPIWGFEFQQLDQDTNQQQEVRTRVMNLVRYLESLQRD